MSQEEAGIECEECGSKRMQSRGTVHRLGKLHRRLRCMEKNCGTNHYFPVDPEGKVAGKAPVEKFVLSEKDVKKIETGYKRFVITSVQNDTQTFEPFKDSLMHYCAARKAKLLIIPCRYKNPDAFNAGIAETYLWDDTLKSYFIENEIAIGSKVRVLGDYPVGATNTNPISNIESIADGKTVVIGHAQLQMKSVARHANEDPAIITTTGSLSVKNYSHSKNGYHAKHGHTNGFVVVELDKKRDIFHIRQVEADDDGCFYDLNSYWTPDGEGEFTHTEGLVTGDEHAIHADSRVIEATYMAKDCIAAVLRPKRLVRHDVMDTYSVSHHHKGSYSQRRKKHLRGEDDLEKELLITAIHIVNTTLAYDKTAENIIVSSNHNSHLTRWMDDFNSADDVKNGKIFAHLRLLSENNWASDEEDQEPFNLWLREWMNASYPELSQRLTFTGEDSVKLAGRVEVSLHGDVGPNGSRGSAKNLSRLGRPVIIGHSHSPCIVGDAYQVGTSSKLRLSYTKGPSAWLHTHAVVYPNGQIQLINIIGGQWRLKD